MTVFFRRRLGKILIWHSFLKRESPALSFCLNFDKANFNIFNVTSWLTNNYNTRIAQYLTK